MPAGNTVNKDLYVASTDRILLRTLSVAEHLEDYHRIWSDPRALIWSYASSTFLSLPFFLCPSLLSLRSYQDFPGLSLYLNKHSIPQTDYGR